MQYFDILTLKTMKRFFIQNEVEPYLLVISIGIKLK